MRFYPTSSTHAEIAFNNLFVANKYKDQKNKIGTGCVGLLVYANGI